MAVNLNNVGNNAPAFVNIDDGFEVYDLPEQPENEGVKQGAENNLAIPEQGKLAGPVLLHGAAGEQFVPPQDLKDRLNAAIEDRYSAGNFFKGLATALGRKIMNLCHAVKCFFCPSLNARGVGDFDALERNPVGVLKNKDDWKDVYRNRESGLSSGALERLAEANPQAYADRSVSYSHEEIGAAFGLRGEVKLAAFDKREIDDIRNGNFSLQDIKQDPGLQDCWFLSTLSSVLASCGKEPLANIIHVPKETKNDEGQPVPPEHAFVKLGQHVYKVPLGEVQTKGGDKSVSNSKPWVKLLETAMQMHLVNTSGTINERNVRMSYRNSKDGFAALFGVSVNNSQASVIGGSPFSTATFDDVSKLFGGHRPVVLGSKDGVGAALGTGISPGHAVAVLDVDAERKQVTVLDPYGHTRLIQEKDLSNFIMVAALPERGQNKDAMNKAGYDDGSFNVPNQYKWPDDSVIIDRIADPDYDGELNAPVQNNNARNNNPGNNERVENGNNNQGNVNLGQDEFNDVDDF